MSDMDLTIDPPDLGLDDELRGILAAEWTRMGLQQHERLGSLAGSTLQLLRVNCPNELLRLTQLAGASIAMSSELCEQMAAAYSNSGHLQRAVAETGFGPRQVAITDDIAMVAANLAQERCVGDTVSCAVLAAAATEATDSAVKAALDRIVENEAQNVALAWRVLKWLLTHGGERTRGALDDVFDDGLAFAVRCSEVTRDLDGHGFLCTKAAEEVSRQALEHVVMPMASMLLQVNDELRWRGDLWWVTGR